jgi:glutamate-5-semialdehyde dehydrogenase
VETLLVHESLLQTIWPEVASALVAADVQLLCDPQTLLALEAFPLGRELTAPTTTRRIRPVEQKDYETEHLSLTLAVRTVPSLVIAIAHINVHGSHHTDCIVAESADAINTFVRGIDSAGVFVNASTRFADGFRYGFGAEVGISTGRIHARGPVGLEGLVTYKYVLRSKDGQGHIVGEFGRGPGKKQYTHQPIQVDKLPL